MLHSGYSSLRLESFLFTEQAFRDIKARLKPGGVFVMYNYYRQGWVVGRLAKLAEKVFGAEPLVISLPYQAKIKPGDNQVGFITFLLAGERGQPDPRPRSASGWPRSEFFWANTGPRQQRPRSTATARRRPTPPGALPEDWNQIGPAEVDTAGVGPHPDRRLALPLPPRADDPRR